jgi:hypothetical protein
METIHTEVAAGSKHVVVKPYVRHHWVHLQCTQSQTTRGGPTSLIGLQKCILGPGMSKQQPLVLHVRSTQVDYVKCESTLITVIHDQSSVCAMYHSARAT